MYMAYLSVSIVQLLSTFIYDRIPFHSMNCRAALMAAPLSTLKVGVQCHIILITALQSRCCCCHPPIPWLPFCQRLLLTLPDSEAGKASMWHCLAAGCVLLTSAGLFLDVLAPSTSPSGILAPLMDAKSSALLAYALPGVIQDGILLFCTYAAGTLATTLLPFQRCILLVRAAVAAAAATAVTAVFIAAASEVSLAGWAADASIVAVASS